MSDHRDVRVLALWRDDPREAPLTVDLRIDVATGLMTSTWDVFGAFDLDGEARRPFVLRRSGEIDFGAACELKWSANLRDTKIAVGACFTVRWNETDSGEYKIVKIAELGAKDGRK
ncbi:hypothetical protein [Methylocystis heyeri]|uniref:Uncharacterized protein n=1 Tax=Methylocystis heyeri TaxID=391905 RepID=A0A6B8KA02_9HYPH|nr:hypothetical protein [Methylocystis heyeri]QGM44557.1 hypothetical protein H2LOC_001985 [Methylocystis heyeri]